MADQIAFMLSLSGSDLPEGRVNSPGTTLKPGLPGKDVPAGVGKQLTLETPEHVPLLDAMLTLASSPTSRVDLIAKGIKDGLPRGWYFDRTAGRFQSDRRNEAATPDDLVALVGEGSELTFTVVPRGSGRRLGVDRDEDGASDRDELDSGTNPNDRGRIDLSGLPESLEVVVNTRVVLQVTVDADVWDLSYQWFKDGEAVAGATDAALLLPNADLKSAGQYAVHVRNSFHSIASSPVRLTVVPLLASITPTNLYVKPGSNATFTVSTVGEGPFSYQWRRDRTDLAGATDPVLRLTNVQLADDGRDSVAVANTYGTYVTQPASLGVLVRPAFVVPPLSQEVVAGGNATFSVAISGNPPPFSYQLRKSSFLLTNLLTDDREFFFTIFNVQPNDAGTYRVVVTNAANYQPGLGSDLFSLTVLTDSDLDGLPDVWEAAHGLATNDPTDAALDADLDGTTNWQEYHAATDPHDRQSFLKIESIDAVNTPQKGAVLSFIAISNHTYTVESRDAVSAEKWTRWIDLASHPTNRLVMLTNAVTLGVTQRIYRLATPRAP